MISDQLSGPVAAGIWRLRVVLPAALIGNLDPKQTQHILAHELAHVARRDQLVVLLQNLVGAAGYPHYLGEGKIDFKAVLQAIADIRFVGFANLETSAPSKSVEQDMRRNLQYIRALMG